MNITLQVNQPKVFDKVAIVTGYTGRKMEGDENAFDRIQTVDEDGTLLDTYFDECRSEVVNAFMDKVVSEGMGEIHGQIRMPSDNYTLVLGMAEDYNTALTPAMDIALFDYFVYGIIARWYMITNKDEAGAYAELAAAALEKMRSMSAQHVFTRRMYPFG